ncbi:C6 zinc finger domain-containing protein [Westerdykella ornata]|uniref:C6 zinc finger domain-containing protein n=1 Tax=Westerdykella ornata TaxID=318751 RepID=A0A6A6JHP7_WESOR|nr:C6 zinc finger domain-containing protein [Westerdykella ornata]KAF2275478.1 C6 zinc finger domain-containing protein [Westerdykella ornata]
MKASHAATAPKPTKKDNSLTLAVQAIRRLEAKIENLTSIVKGAHDPRTDTAPDRPPPAAQASPNAALEGNTRAFNHVERRRTHHAAPSSHTVSTPGAGPDPRSGRTNCINLSFSQHEVASWPAVKQILPGSFVSARETLPRQYIIEIESERTPLPIEIQSPLGPFQEHWLRDLPLSVIKGLSEAYFAVFHRSTPVLDKYYFLSSTLSIAMETEFGYDIESCLILVVLALGCLAVKAHEEGSFPLPCRSPQPVIGFVAPEWYDLILDDPPGLKFFNEARKRFGFLMCQHDIQSAQFSMLCTVYYAQILRPIESWSTVNRAALCCITILKRSTSIDFDKWDGDMFSRVFWATLMYETIITQELDLPLSGLLDYEADMPIPKFTPCPRPKTSISQLIIDEDDSYFNFHFLAQAAHRILLTRIRHNLYSFVEKAGSPTPTITAEMHHQLEQWRANLPPALQFTDADNEDDSPSPAHVIARAMLRSRYLVAKFHIGRPFLYKALHYPTHTTDGEYEEIAKGLQGAMFWPTTTGQCAQMKSALPIKFGWCSQCFGQVLMFHAIARSPDMKLRATLPPNWEEWVKVMVSLIEDCGRESPGIAKDAELLKLL